MPLKKYLPSVEGIILPAFPHMLKDARQRLQDISNLSMRKDDIIIASYPKSGNHWMNEIVPRLLLKSQNISHELHHSFLDFIPDLKTLESMSSPRVFTTHLPYRWLPKEHIENGGKVIHIIRNPKDAALSAFHHYKQDQFVLEYISAVWEEFLDDFIRGDCIYGSWFEMELEWETVALQNPDSVFVLYYEDMQKNGLENIMRMSKFLGFPCDETFGKIVLNDSSFANVKEKKGNDYPIQFYRKGVIGDWKSTFTIAQNEKFDCIFEEKMKDSKLNIQFT